MKFPFCCSLAVTGVLLSSLVAARATNADVEWDNGAANNDWSNATNWSGNVLPTTGTGTTGDKIHINLGGVNRARFTASEGAKTYQWLRIGDATTGAELEVTGGTLFTDSTTQTRIATGGRTATLNQSGGTVGFGGYLQVGLDANSVGNINLNGGTLISSRNGTVGIIPGVSMVLGDGNNAQGNFVLSGGEFRTRTGVLLGNPANTGEGRFEVRGAGIANIGTENAADDGFWVQSSGSTLAAYVEDGALGIVFVDNLAAGAGGTYADGNVIFAPGSLLEVGFTGAPIPGTWDVMRWEGTLLTNGLAFAPGVTDTNWSFAFVDTDGVNGADTLRISYGTPALAPFVHPGGMHTEVDFFRMRTKVAANAQPWLDGWNKLLANSHAQVTWTPNPQPIIYRGFDGTNPENYGTLYNDIAAAYQCALRYHVSGDPNYANKAVQIMNAWAVTLTNISGTSDKFLASGIYGYQFANVGEMMSRYSGWKNADKAAFRAMMLNVFYPMNHDFLVRHNGTCLGHYWANWDLCNMASIAAIGVLCDDQAKFAEAVNYFMTGQGNGSIGSAVFYVHPGQLGQWQESGRDQGHNTLGVALMGPLCEVAWNQGVDLYGYAGNRFLAGCEYIAKYNLTNDVPYVTYNNCDNVNQTVISTNGRGTIRACWEMVYNHYVNRMGLTAPYTAQITTLARPEGGGGDYGPNSGGYDQLGFGTLTYTRDLSGAVPPARPSVPIGLAATAPACGQINLSWNAVAGATGYNIMRSTVNGGPYTTLLALEAGATNYTDATVLGVTTYYYVVSAVNTGGESDFSVQASATSSVCPQPGGWLTHDIGGVTTAGGANLTSNTFTVKGAGSDVGGTADSFRFVYRGLANNGEITARWVSLQLGGSEDKVGLMMRETTNANSKTVALLYDENNSFNRLRLPRRSSPGANMVYPAGQGPVGTPLPLWLRLARTNDIFTGSYSADGVNWTPVATVTNAGTPSVLWVGLEVCSRNPDWLGTAVFDNVSVTGVWPLTVATNPVPLGAAVVGGSLQLSWPADHTGWRLEVQTNTLAVGLRTNWFTVSGSAATNQVSLPIDSANGSLFFRLVYP
jgi:hypothetical protein